LDPGGRHGYHVVTLGWYEGELIRRADPAGRSLGQFFAEEIAEPLGLDFYIGLPASVNRDRVAYLHAWSLTDLLLHLNTMPPRFVAAAFNPFSLTARSNVIAKGIASLEHFNREALRVVEMPASNGTGTARSIAKLYGNAATGGSELGLTPSTLDALKEPAIPPTNGLRDKVLHVDTTFSLGFQARPRVRVRFLRERVWNAWTWRLVRIRRPGHWRRVRVCDEPARFPHG
jgi:CubicO group peptidase (beta-lactamase class C family)